MTARNTLATACAGLMFLSVTSVRTFAEHKNSPDSQPKSSVSSEPSHSLDSPLELNGDPSVRGDQGTAIHRGLIRDPNSPANIENHRQGVAESNKASCLIGMEVRNQQNEKLGDIKDVVIDLPLGRISYIVLSTGGFLGIGNRLIAVPPSAFHLGTDPDHMVIITDKQTLMNAPSFAKTNWPDPKSGNFDTYWGTEREAVGGASAGVSAGSATGRSSKDHAMDRSGDRNASRYSNDRSSANHIFKGKIVAIDPEARAMTVEGEDGSRHDFGFTDRPNLTLTSNRNPHLIDFKVGYPVTVGYHEEGDGKCVAHRVTRINTSEVR